MFKNQEINGSREIGLVTPNQKWVNNHVFKMEY